MKRKAFLRIAMMPAVFFAFQACGGFQDIEELDTTVALFKNQEFVLMESQEYTIGQFLDLNGSTFIKTGENGYEISFQLAKQELSGFTFESSNFAFNVSSSFDKSISISEDSVIPKDTPIDYAESDKDYILSLPKYQNVDMDFFQHLLEPREFKFNFAMDFSINSFPELIKAFKEAELGGTIHFELTPSGIPFSAVTLKEGTSISFPSFLKFSQCDNDGFNLVDGNKLVAKSDIPVTLGQALAFNLSLQSIQHETQTSGSLQLSDVISFDGNIFVKASDFSGETETIAVDQFAMYPPYHTFEKPIVLVKNDTPIGNVNVNCSYSTNNVSLLSATIQLTDDVIPVIQPISYEVTGVPETISNGLNVALSQVQIGMSVDSKLPFDVTLGADLSTYVEGKSQPVHEYKLGPLSFPSNEKTQYSLGDHETAVVGDIHYEQISGLGSILAPIPNRVEAGNFLIDFDESQWITLDLSGNKSYGVTFEASLDAPVAFTGETEIAVSMDKLDISIPSELKDYVIKSAEISFKAVNTIPFIFDLNLIAKDKDGKEVDIDAKLNKLVAAGTLENPASTDIVISTNLTKANEIASFNIDIIAKQDPDLAGTPLHPDQGFKLEKIVLKVPDGVSKEL